MKRYLLLFMVAVLVSLAVSSAVTAKEPVTVTMMSAGRDTMMIWENEMKKQFETTHPNIKLEIISIAGTDVTNKMQALLAAGEPLDIGYQDPWFILEWARQGLVEDISPYIKGDSYFRDWYPAALNLYRLGGKLYGLPQGIQITTVFYNKDMFREAGIQYPSSDWTYDDLASDARRLTKKSSDGSVTEWGFSKPGSRNYVPIIWAFGGDLLDNWNEPTRFTGNTSAVADAFEYMADMVKSEGMADRMHHASTKLQNNNLAMYLSNTYALSRYSQIDNFEWDIAPMPLGPAGRTPFVNAEGWFMLSNSKHKEETWEVLRFLNSTEAWEKQVEITGSMPPSARLIQTSWLPSQSMPASRNLLFMGVDNAGSPWPTPNEIWMPMYREGDKAIWGDQAVGTALQTMGELVTPILEERSK